MANPAAEDSWTFNGLQLTAGTAHGGKDRVRATATISLVDADGAEHVEAAIGNGPVEATFKAINRIIKMCSAGGAPRARGSGGRRGSARRLPRKWE